MAIDYSKCYRCLKCQRPLEPRDRHFLDCAACAESYPIIEGIPILAPRPRAQLSNFRSALDAAAGRIHPIAAGLDTHLARDDSNVISAPRINRAVEGMRLNRQLLQICCESLQAFPWDSNPGDYGLLDAIATSNSSWSADDLLSYFFQDWGETADFAFVRSLISQALDEHVRDRRTVAVLGAGACGLVHAVAAQFRTAFGIDLSLAGLLMANRLLSGGSLQIRLPEARWKEVTLCREGTSSVNIQLLVADAYNLPFVDRNFCAVITQYLMDLVGNPMHCIGEIHRVLDSGGIWINFSLPFRLPDEPAGCGRPDMAEFKDQLRESGFDMIESSLQRYTVNDLGTLDPYARHLQQTVHFTVVRKRDLATDVVTSDSSPDNDRWWRRVPRFSAGRCASVSDTTLFSSQGETTMVRISTGWGKQFELSEEHTATLSAILRLIGPGKSMSSIYGEFTSCGGLLSQSEFRELMKYLIDRDALLELLPS
jgi:SAM-dependent methyltransferase